MAHLGQSRSVISRLEPAQTSIHMLWSVLAGWRVWLVLMFKRTELVGKRWWRAALGTGGACQHELRSGAR